ncbi:MAG: hypothetical protein IJX90_12245 [Blautia sp.]|nr:hypothetical protein [Blautia sp.]
MFDKFGEMDSAKEINERAENLLKEGDIEGLKTMAKENGIPEEYVEMYTGNAIPFLTDEITAANGKLDLECEELKPKGLMEDWCEYIRGLTMENLDMAAAVRKKGKRLKSCMASLLAYSFANRQQVDKEIVKEAKISAGRVDFGVPGSRDARRLIREYYQGGAGK